MSEFKVGDYIVRVKKFDNKKLLKIVWVGLNTIECNDGLFYSIEPEWTRLATPEEIKVGRRL